MRSRSQRHMPWIEPSFAPLQQHTTMPQASCEGCPPVRRVPCSRMQVWGGSLRQHADPDLLLLQLLLAELHECGAAGA